MEQLSFDWERIERNIAARNSLIGNLPVDQRVKKLLQTLGELAFECTLPRESLIKLPDGSTSIALPWIVLGFHAGVKSKNTIKAWVKLASTTPYLTVVPSSHEATLLTVHWQELLSTSDAPVITGGKRPVITGGDQQEGVNPLGRRGSIDRAEGVNLDSRGGQFPTRRGSIGGQLEGVNSPPKPSQRRRDGNGLCISELNHKYKNHQPSPSNETARNGQRRLPYEQWCRWLGEVSRRNLRSAGDVAELYEIAVREGLVLDCEDGRNRLFGQACQAVRVGISPQKLFAINIAHDFRASISDADFDAARKLMRSLDRRAPEREMVVVAAPVPAATAVERRSVDRSPPPRNRVDGGDLDRLGPADREALLLAACGGDPGRVALVKQLGPVAIRQQLLRHIELTSPGDGSPITSWGGGAKDVAAAPGGRR